MNRPVNDVARHPLDRLLGSTISAEVIDTPRIAGGPARIHCAAPQGAPRWLQRESWRVFARCADNGDGEPLASFELSEGGGSATVRRGEDGTVHVPFSLAEAHDNYVSERWRSAAPQVRLSARQLDLFYAIKRAIPRRVQLAARRRLIRRQGRPEFPAWPLDESMWSLLRFYAGCLLLASGSSEMPVRWFWPAGRDAALILTHDVESEDGLRLAVEIADLEQARGMRSSFNVVADWYRIDDGILRELTTRGFELGVHGIFHDRSMFSSRESFERQRPLVAQTRARFGAAGFRSPATHRVFEWLGDLPVDYDCTMPNSDPYEPIPGGTCTVWPFFLGEVLELSYTLPQDHTLLTLLGETSAQMWIEGVDRISRIFGLAQVVTHPDPGYLGDRDKRRIYEDFLDQVAERPRLWRALPREVANWWRARDRAEATANGTVRADDDPFLPVFVPPPGGDRDQEAERRAIEPAP